ncbi:MAG: hypothetical protein ILP23_04275 [Paludibacteraceae bacterium]|nr:hypothetical protein [Paludibacteraceae bacterium]
MLTLSANVSAQEFAPLQYSDQAEADTTFEADNETDGVEAAFAVDDKTAKALTDSIDKEQSKKQWSPNPRHALYYSLVPGLGLGQIYNRKYWKLPIVYAGYAALIYAIIYTNGKYSDYRKAYISIADEDESTTTWQKYIPAGQTAEDVDKSWLTNALNQRYMRFRRYRDLSIIGIVAWYGLSIIDAFVDAQLFNFDITPDLSLRVEPEIRLNEYRNVGVNCTLSF